MGRILISEPLAERGVEFLREAGHDVDLRPDLSAEELPVAAAQADALIIRSATRVTADVLSAAHNLKVVGRAGIGLDNVDVEAATRAGVMVVNAPQSNILSAAEHTIALMLAQARNIPQASAALKAGRWERSKWEGVELSGKTLGIVGLGRVGALVASRALAFGMHLAAYDPYVTEERARQMGVELMTLEKLVREADFLTVHLPKTPETVGLIGKDLLAQAKPGLRIVNAARGQIVDEEALALAIREGRIAGAALDVFSEEPCTSSPVFELDSVVVTPHLGASTAEAQDKAGVTIAEQVVLALAGDFVPFAVNISASEAPEVVRPFLPLAERLGRAFGSLVGGVPPVLELEYTGAIGEYDTRILTLSVLKGLFAVESAEHVTYVNAPQLAEERGLEVRQTCSTQTSDYVNLIVIRAGGRSIAGTLSGSRSEPRIVMVDDHDVEVPPMQHMLIVRNDDRPGMMGVVGTILGESNVNIADMALGRSPAGGSALMILSVDDAVPADVLDRISSMPGVLEAKAIDEA